MTMASFSWAVQLQDVGAREIAASRFDLVVVDRYDDDDPPPWLGPENPDWPGNFQVRYWMPGWKALLFDYLDGILAAGFDGVFLDVVDVYQSRLADAERADPARDMVELVREMSAYAKRLDPDFRVFVNNAEE